MGEIIRAVTDEGTAKISVITARDAVERARQSAPHGHGGHGAGPLRRGHDGRVDEGG